MSEQSEGMAQAPCCHLAVTLLPHCCCPAVSLLLPSDPCCYYCLAAATLLQKQGGSKAAARKQQCSSIVLQVAGCLAITLPSSCHHLEVTAPLNSPTPLACDQEKNYNSLLNLLLPQKDSLNSLLSPCRDSAVNLPFRKKEVAGKRQGDLSPYVTGVLVIIYS